MDTNSFILASISFPDKYQGPPCSPCLFSGWSWLGKDHMICMTILVELVVKNPPINAGDIRDADSISVSGRFPGGGLGNPLQYSCWRIPWPE